MEGAVPGVAMKETYVSMTLGNGKTFEVLGMDSL